MEICCGFLCSPLFYAPLCFFAPAQSTVEPLFSLPLPLLCPGPSQNQDDGDLGAENEKLKSEISSHKRQLEALKEKDPEFYAYLQARAAATRFPLAHSGGRLRWKVGGRLW